MPDLSNTHTIAQLDLLLKTLTFLIAVGLAVKAILEYIRAQRWKRFEFMAQQLKDFNADPQVRTVMAMLDWENRAIALFPERETNKIVVVTPNLLITALYPTDDGPDGNGYTDEQVRIRDLFDTFFDKLSFFSVVLRSGLIHRQDLAPHLRYWCERLAVPSHKGGAFVKKRNGIHDLLWVQRRKLAAGVIWVPYPRLIKTTTNSLFHSYIIAYLTGRVNVFGTVLAGQFVIAR